MCHNIGKLEAARVDHPEHRSPRHHDSVNTLRFLRRVSAPTFHALPFPPLAARVRVLCRCCICCCPTVAAISMSRALLCPASAAIAAPLLSLRCRAHCCALSLPLLLSYVSPESLCSIPRTCCRCQCVLQLYCVSRYRGALPLPILTQTVSCLCAGVLWNPQHKPGPIIHQICKGANAVSVQPSVSMTSTRGTCLL